MPNNRTPQMKAEAEGRHLKNPKRYANRRDPESTPLGEPSVHLGSFAVTAFEAYRKELPWVMESDRSLVEAASILRGKMIENQDLGVSSISALSSILSKLGATPADRTKISLPDDEEEDDEFFDN